MDNKVVIHKKIDEDKDSIEIGTPGKGGAIKVYGDSSDPDTYKIKIRNMIMLRKFTTELLDKD